MNPIQSIKNFGQNVVGGAKILPSTLKLVGNDLKNSVLGKKKTAMATKMKAPIPPSPSVTDTVPPGGWNRGFHAYKDRLDEALKY